MFKLNPEALAEYQKVRNTNNPNIICHAPFSNINFEQGGNATACCYNRKHVLGKFPEQTIRQMWFGEKAEELRNYIKAQDFNHGCELCANQINSFNFENSRLKGFDEYGEKETLKLKLKQKLGFKSATYPKCFEFEIDNICNLECVMCDGKFSSLIRQNRENLSPIISPYNDEFVNEVALYIPYLKEAKFLGGEPFLTPLYYKIWDKIIALNPNLNISITTNATVLTKKVKTTIESLNAHIILSIDSINKSTYEQIRLNANYDKVWENIQYFFNYGSKTNRPLTLAVCPMTLNYLEIPEIIDFCNKNNAKIFFNTVDRPYRLSLMALSFDDLEQAKELYKSYLENPTTPFVFKNKQMMQDLLHFINSLSEVAKRNLELLDKFEDLNRPLLIESNLKEFFEIYLKIQNSVYFHSQSEEYDKLTEGTRNEIQKMVETLGFSAVFKLLQEIVINTFKINSSFKKDKSQITESLQKLFVFISQNPDYQFGIFWRILNVRVVELIQGIEFTPTNQIEQFLTKEFNQ
jgi:MoaA/NifB/PqqE/SkfB family radical SAM enzyme